MEDSKAVSTLIDGYECIKLAINNEPMADQLEYQKAVGSLMYAMTPHAQTWPSLWANSVSFAMPQLHVYFVTSKFQKK